MNARACYTPETRDGATENCRWVSSSYVAMGTCLCGTIHYAVDRPSETLSHYNDPAGNAHPGPDRPGFVAAPLVAFRWVAGEEWLTNYDSAEGTSRSFCRWCGSAMPVTTRDKATMLLPLASLERPVAVPETGHPMPA
jgi:hypothetical protein